MIRRPPRSTLLPDTTLFRSLPAVGSRDRLHERAVNLWSRQSGGAASIWQDHPLAPTAPPTLQRQAHRHSRSVRDRKSTRLNSSYANISYAVFCLKKQSLLSS